MTYRKVMKVVLSATRLDLDRLPWPQAEQFHGEIVGVATIKSFDKGTTDAQFAKAGSFVLEYLNIINGRSVYDFDPAGPFIFSVDKQVNLLSFIRDLREYLVRYSDCDRMKLSIKFS